ncbi:MAG: hypothetical protein O2840_00515 [bacterium]|nr:hypothetical protein [bacterium]
MNTQFTGKIINDDKRAIIWIPDFRTKNQAKKLSALTTTALIASGEIKLRPKTFSANDMPYLLQSTALFARKFDETTDATLFDLLEKKIRNYSFSNLQNITSGTPFHANRELKMFSVSELVKIVKNKEPLISLNTSSHPKLKSHSYL